MSVDTRLMTADELLQMPDDGMKHELVRGELRTMAPAGSQHGRIAGYIHGHLWRYVAERKLGDVLSSDTGFILTRDPATVRCPDVSFVEKTRPTDARGFFVGTPDLAVEVISPNDLFSEVQTKVSEYLIAGCRVIIVVDPGPERA